MNIAVLGGKFDPPHFGHLLVINQILEKVDYIDKVLLIPVNTHPWKTIVASPADRLAMIKLLKSDRIEVADIDIKRGGQTFTIDTIKELTANKANKYYWVSGSDILSEFDKWKDHQESKSKHPPDNMQWRIFSHQWFYNNKINRIRNSIDNNQQISKNIIRGSGRMFF